MSGVKKAFLSVWVISMACSSGIFAADGVIEINQTCALYKGCLEGDEAGFPVTLGVAGSYRLTGNLDVPRDLNGIRIEHTRVTLDLNGFSLEGFSIGLGPGIVVAASNVEVYGGYISGFDYGIDMFAGVDGVRLIDLRLTNNRTVGLRVVGAGHRIENCAIFNNVEIGLTFGASLFSGAAAMSNNVIRNNETNVTGTTGGFIEFGVNQCGDDTTCP